MANATEEEVAAGTTPVLLRLKPPRIAMVLLLVSIGLHYLLRNRMPFQFRHPICGAILVALGFMLMMGAWSIFRQQETAICPTAAARVLVESGPFRFTRNPMYMGMTAILTGCALVLGTLPMLLAPLVFFFLMNAVFIPFEETRMLALFGQRYIDYSRCVRRWL